MSSRFMVKPVHLGYNPGFDGSANMYHGNLEGGKMGWANSIPTWFDSFIYFVDGDCSVYERE